MASILPDDFVQMLEKTNRQSIIVYGLLYQNLIRSLLGTISFIQGFNFDIK